MYCTLFQKAHRNKFGSSGHWLITKKVLKQCVWGWGGDHNWGTGSNQEQVFKGPMGRCKATIPSYFSLISDSVNY